MRILADEGFPGSAVTALRRRGNDVLWVSEHSPGSEDIEILRLAENEI